MKIIKSLKEILNTIKEILKLIDRRIRLWGAIILFISSILILLIFSKNIPFNEWYVYLFFAIVIIVALGSVLDLILPEKSGSYKKLVNIDKKINGTWGEFMHNHPYISLSVVKIKFNSSLIQYLLEGEAYNKMGEKVADWHSVASAVTQFDPPVIHYFWEGKVLKPSIENKSGIGVLKFSSSVKEQPCIRATGFYTSENIEQLKLSGKYDIELLRFTEEEQAKLKLSKEEIKTFIAEKHSHWKK